MTTGSQEGRQPAEKASPRRYRRTWATAAPVVTEAMASNIAPASWAQTSDPFQVVIAPDGRTVCVVRGYDEAVRVLSDPRLDRPKFSVTTAGQDQDEPIVLTPSSDEQHRLMMYYGSSPRCELRRARLGEVAAALIDRMAASDQADLMDDFAMPLVYTILCEVIGIPERDRKQLLDWSQEWRLFVLTGGSEVYRCTARRAVYEYMSRLLAEKDEQPADDLTTGLAAARRDGRLPQEEAVAGAAHMLLNGYPNAASFIATMLLAMLLDPAKCSTLAAQPALIPAAVEEFLRFISPVTAGAVRASRTDLRIDDTLIEAGTLIDIHLATANRDPRRFTDPDRIDLDRSDNAHLAFGHGQRYCPGATLARIEAQAALTAMLPHLGNITLTVPVAELKWTHARFGNPTALEAFPVTWRRSAHDSATRR